MISSIEITHFRGIREGKLEDLTPLTVLVGPNGCGKSTVLDALLIGASPEPGDGIGRAVVRHHGVIEGPRWLFWRADARTAAKIDVITQEGAWRRCQLELRKGSPHESPGVQCVVEWANPSKSSKGNCRTEFRVAGDYQCTLHDNVPALEDIPEIRLIEAHRDRLHVPLHQLYSESRKIGRREEVKAIIADVVPDITDVEILTEQDKPILYLIYKDSAVPVALAGDGIHALVRVTLELAVRPEGVVLFEEPEVHQHPRAIRQAVRAILAAVRRDIQVVLTTHSLELIDILLAESSDDDIEKLSLYRLELEDGRLISVRRSGSDVAFSRCEIEKDLR